MQYNTFIKPHLNDLDRLTGVAIFLVVIGHLVTGETKDSDGLEWYKFLKQLIYSFHMPLFMFISGYIFFYTFSGVSNCNEYITFIKKKFIRLIPSYVFFVIVIFIGKISLQSYLAVDNPIESTSSFLDAFTKPSASYAGFLWYIYVLFEYYLVFPIILKLLKNNIEILLIISLPLHFLSFSNVLAINLFFEFLFFFILGMVAVKYRECYLRVIDRYSLALILFFLLLCSILYFYLIPKILMGIISIPAIHSLVRKNFISSIQWLSILGEYSFSIYLMNTLASGFVKAIGFKYLNWTYANFYIPAVIMVLCGLLVPIVVKKYIFNNIPFIKKYIG